MGADWLPIGRESCKEVVRLRAFSRFHKLDLHFAHLVGRESVKTGSHL